MKIRFQHQGQDHSGYVQELDGKVWIHLNGETKCLGETSRKSRSKGVAKKSDQIVSPMPGKVTKIFKKAGETVDIGQAVIAIEAMKMEYILNSEVKGQVTDIKVQESDQIKEGQLLAQIKESK